MHLLNGDENDYGLKIKVVRPRSFRHRKEDRLTKHILVYGLRANHLIEKCQVVRADTSCQGMHQERNLPKALQSTSPHSTVFTVDSVSAVREDTSSSGVSSWSAVTKDNRDLGLQQTSSAVESEDLKHPLISHASSQTVSDDVVPDRCDHQRQQLTPSLTTSSSATNVCFPLENGAKRNTTLATPQEEVANPQCPSRHQQLMLSLSSSSSNSNSVINTCHPAEKVTSCAGVLKGDDRVNSECCDDHQQLTSSLGTSTSSVTCNTCYPVKKMVPSRATTSATFTGDTVSKVHDLARKSSQLQIDNIRQHCPNGNGVDITTLLRMAGVVVRATRRWSGRLTRAVLPSRARLARLKRFLLSVASTLCCCCTCL